MRSLCFVMMGALLGGCDTPSAFSDVPLDVCKKQHKNGEMAVCDELYAAPPYVHLPTDSDFEVFAGVENDLFVTVKGASYSGIDKDVESLRHGFVLYQVLLDGDAVSEYRPAVQFDASVFFKELFGRAADGLLSRRTADETWEFEPTLPVRVEFQAESADEPLVSILNLEEAVTAADGTCLPALSSYGDEATFPSGSSVELRAGRVPSMHEFGDHHFTMSYSVDGEDAGNLMNPAWYRGPIDVARGTLAVTGTYEGFGHATPGAVPTLFIDLVQGGGEPCTP